jgi:hypothetical protein
MQDIEFSTIESRNYGKSIMDKCNAEKHGQQKINKVII